MKSTLILMLASALTWLGGCDWVAQKTLQPGVSTEADVRKLMGEPEVVWEENDGERVLEYPRAPGGTETYMVSIGPDGKFRSMSNVLVPAMFEQVKSGMHREQVRRLLGKPTDIVFFQLSSQEVWSFKHVGKLSYVDNFNVHFNLAGQVVNTSLTRDPQHDNT